MCILSFSTIASHRKVRNETFNHRYGFQAIWYRCFLQFLPSIPFPWLYVFSLVIGCAWIKLRWTWRRAGPYAAPYPPSHGIEVWRKPCSPPFRQRDVHNMKNPSYIFIELHSTRTVFGCTGWQYCPSNGGICVFFIWRLCCLFFYSSL